MKRGLGFPREFRGFTIVETLIFLAVSAGILVSAFTLISGSQNRTEFSQAINDARQQLDTISNNVANGFYPRINDFACSVGPGGLDFSGPADARGTNQACVFLGRVIQFNESDEFTVYNVAGARLVSGTNTVVNSMVDAVPTVVRGTEETLSFKNGLKVFKVKFKDGAEIGAMGYFSDFGVGSNAAELESAALRSDYAGIPNTTLGVDEVESRLNATGAGSFRDLYAAGGIRNPASGIQICLDSASTLQYGVITIGGDNRAADSTLDIKNGRCDDEF